jgi:protein-S-isoprenylcysteine O-methyltransferase Ste14
MIRLAGLACFLFGLGLRRWALRELRQAGIETLIQLAIPAVPRQYTTAGPYRWLRHPCYIGSYLILAGLGLAAFGVWAGAMLWLPAVPHYNQRKILEEERRAVQEFHHT